VKKHITEKIILIDRAALKPYANNARTHSDEQINQIIASITEFGFTNPLLVDEEYSIIAGHGRLAAATKMGMGKLPCVVVAGLTGAQRKALVLADNKIALNSGWDTALLKIELCTLSDAGFDLKLTGFDVPELSLILGFGADFAAGREDDQSRLDQKAPLICPACSHEFYA
jgi:ParB-like chromosome segregation protein Spo0J